MANALFGLGRQNFAAKQFNVTSDTLKGTLLTMSSAAGKIALISNVTNATPMVVTTTASHGYSNGDIVTIAGVLGNLAANGTFQISSASGSTFTLLTKLDGNNTTGSGAYTSGGWVIDLSLAQILTDISGNSTGTDVTLTSVTNTLGIVGAANFTWSSLTATQVYAIGIYDSSTASSDLLAFYDGRYQVYVVTTANTGATSIAVNRLGAVIPSGSVLYFSNGASATTTAQNSIGATSLSVSSLAATISVQSTADAYTLSAGLPVTPASGGSLQFTVDTTSGNKLFAL